MPTDPGRSALDDRAAETRVGARLTNRQTLFWVGQKLAAEHPVYNIAFVYEIDGALDPDLFVRAFAATVSSTDSLRLTVAESDGVPEQRVLGALDHELEILDLTGSEDPSGGFEQWLDHRLALPMPMAERLFDSALVRLAAERWAWFLSQHHIVTDGWSMAIIYQRVAAAYEHLAGGGSASDVPRAASFLSYVDRERAERLSTEFERAERYRLRKLATEIPAVRFYRSGPVERSRFERRAVLRLDAERTADILRVATEAQMPSRLPQQGLFLVFSSLLAIYLHRISGNDDLGIGLVFHNRLTDQDRETAGLYVNLFPLHLHVEARDTFVTMMRKSLAESFAAVRYGPHCISNPGRQRSYEVVFNYLPMTYAEFAGRPARARWAHTGASDGNHSLSLHVHDFDASGELSLVFDFNTGVFEVNDQQRLLADFEGLVDEFLHDPHRQLRSLSLQAVGEPQSPVEATPTSGDRPALEPPTDDVQAGLVDVWENLLGRSPIGIHDNFFDLGGHSLLAASLVTRVEAQFGWRLALTSLFERPTIAELAETIDPPRQATGPASEEPDILLPVRASGSRTPFFCVPGAGGHGFRLYNLAHQLEADRPFYAFQPLEEAADRSVEQTATIYCEAMRAAQSSGPYLLGGTCLGALVAYEMARQLRTSGEEVRLLAVLNLRGDPDYRAYRRASAWLDSCLRLFRREPPSRHDRLIDLLWLVRRSRRRARQAVADPTPELRALALGQTRSALGYKPQPYTGRVTLFMAADTPEQAKRDERAEWESLVGGDVEICEVPGNHDTVLEQPNVGELARGLSRLLAVGEPPPSDEQAT